ncbi:MAG TPA: 3-hydroxybenzoate 6-monooxygenase [Burkholderiales bacterium]|nr:3-hydroxybenzoate 6-monooxygenase [Burkholderiales bacterium]
MQAAPSHRDSRAPFLISGGGIGGLATALGLANQGCRAIVLEQAREFAEIGAGIQIGPNAFHCFDALGIGDEARACAVFIDKLRLMDGLSGEEICHIPLDKPFREFFRNPYAVVHRGDLHGVLLNACRHHDLIELHTDHRLLSYNQDCGSVTAVLDRRDPVTGQCLIGADGLHSAVRSQLIGDGAPRVSGHTTYRSVIPVEQMPEDLRWNAVTLWAGPKCHIVHYPLKGGKVFNLVVTYHNDVTEAVAGEPVSKDEVRRGFERIHPCAQQIIEHGKDWKLWVLCDREPVENWLDSRVALLGDAAHPMLQYFAQGACMALEDAVCLSQLVGQHERVEDALAAYNAQRFMRTARVQIQSRLIGEFIYHPADGIAAFRDATMRAKSPQDWFQTMDWLYGTNAQHAAQVTD